MQFAPIVGRKSAKDTRHRTLFGKTEKQQCDPRPQNTTDFQKVFFVVLIKDGTTKFLLESRGSGGC